MQQCAPAHTKCAHTPSEPRIGSVERLPNGTEPASPEAGHKLVVANCVTRLKLVAFIATLAMLYIGRGTGRWITQTRAMNLPDAFLALGSAKASEVVAITMLVEARWTE